MTPEQIYGDAIIESKKCAKCGACRSVCPVFESESKTEIFSARGKIALFEVATTGNISKRFHHILHNCLLCLACVKICSNGVRVDKIIIAARYKALEHLGKSGLKSMVCDTILPNPLIANFVFKSAAYIQPIPFKKIPLSSGLHNRFNFTSKSRQRFIPKLQKKTFREMVPAELISTNEKEKIILFTGCSVNHLMPDIGYAAIRILKRLNISLIIPKLQGCCGAPVEASGDLVSYHKIIKQNLGPLSYPQKYKIITLCASGGYMLKKKYPEFFKHHKQYPQAKQVAESTYDISEFLAKFYYTALKKILTKKIKNLTYHDPCHLVRGQDIVTEPRALLSLITDDFVEMEKPDKCCGSGGSYNLDHKTNYDKMLTQKILSIRRTQTQNVATGCPACIIALKDGLENLDITQQSVTVKHPIEFMADVLD